MWHATLVWSFHTNFEYRRSTLKLLFAYVSIFSTWQQFSQTTSKWLEKENVPFQLTEPRCTLHSSNSMPRGPNTENAALAPSAHAGPLNHSTLSWTRSVHINYLSEAFAENRRTSRNYCRGTTPPETGCRRTCPYVRHVIFRASLSIIYQRTGAEVSW